MVIKILKNDIVFEKYLSKTTMPGWSHEMQSTSSAESYEINKVSLAQAKDSFDHSGSTATTSFADSLIDGSISIINNTHKEERSVVEFENQHETEYTHRREQLRCFSTEQVEYEDQIKIEQPNENIHWKLKLTTISSIVQGNETREASTAVSEQLQAHEFENQQGTRYNQLVVQDQQGIKYSRERMRSYQPLKVLPAYEYKNQQEVEYVRGKQRSHNPAKALPTQEQEIRQGIEYIREKKGSQPKALPIHKDGIRQGMEYVREKKGSQPKALPIHKDEIRQGMEYVREKKGSQPKALPAEEHNIRQGMEYVRQKKGSHEQPKIIPRHEYEIRQGIEFVRENKGSHEPPNVLSTHENEKHHRIGNTRKRSEPQSPVMLEVHEHKYIQGTKNIRNSDQSRDSSMLLTRAFGNLRLFLKRWKQKKIFVSPESKKRRKITAEINKITEALRAPETDEVQRFTMRFRLKQLRWSLDNNL